MVLLVSFACSLFTPNEAVTPTPDHIFPEVTTPLKIGPDSLPNAQIGVEYQVEIQVSDNVTPVAHVYISEGALPAGLELVFDQDEGISISGTPEQAGTFAFVMFITCHGTMVGGQTGDKEYTIIVEK